MPIPVTAYSHVRLTVADMQRSRAFYDAVFAFPTVIELPPDADEATRERMAWLDGGVVYRFAGCLLGLRPVGDDAFNEGRVGLDHLSFAVSSRADIDAAAATLDALGIAHEPVKDIGAGYILEFRDPDNIALELMAPK